MDFMPMSDEDILAIATPIMDNLMAASTAMDHERHIRDFTDRAKSVLSEDYFQFICEDYQKNKGFFSTREFVAAFRRPDSLAVVWKQHFTKQAGEFLAELVLIRKNDKFLVDHVMVL